MRRGSGPANPGRSKRKIRMKIMIMNLAIAATFLVPSSAAAQKLKGTKPNIILIITDDQGYGDLSCHGNPILKTPNLDRLYARSVRFTDWHVSPTCPPPRPARV